jgi:PAS domain S-box-containing protein
VRDVGTLETELLLPAGTHRRTAIWCTLALRRTHETAPGAIGMVVVLADATRMKSQQSELEALARERELMFNLSDVGIVYQRDGQIARANQAMADLVGYAPEALTGSPVSLLYESEGTWSHYLHGEKRDLVTTGRSHGERQVRRRDGSLFWAQVTTRHVAVEQPAAGTIVSFVDVDDRQRARESLVQQADRTRAILDSVLVGIVTVGDTGIEWMNRSARRMFGGELADFVGAPISVVAGDELDHPLRRTDYGETLEEGQAETFECRLRARDGRHFWVVGNVVVTSSAAARPR